MATEIAKAYVQIVPSTDGIKGKLEQALGNEASSVGAKTGTKLGGAIGGGLKSAAAIGAAAIGAVTVAVGATTAAMGAAISSTAKYGDEIDKQSQKLGISSKAYQEWDAVLKHSGTSMQSMTSTFKTLANASQDATKDQQAAFEKLGLSMEQVRSMSTEELFSSVISGLQGMEEGTERTAIATDLLGRGSMELGALLNTSAEDTQAMIQAVNDLGGVMSDEAVKAAAAYQDSLQDLQTTFTGIKTKMTADFLPAMSDVMSGLAKVFSGQSGGTEQIQKGIESIATTAQTMIPKMTSIFQQLMPTIVTVIKSSLPVLIQAGGQILMTIIDAILSNLSDLVSTGLSIILEIANSIGSALPTLIPTIVEVVLQITETILDNIDLLVDSAILLIEGLADGIISALPILIEKSPIIIEKLVSSLASNIPKLLEVGMRVQMELGKALVQNLPLLLAKVPSLVVSLVKSYITYASKMLEVGKKLATTAKDGLVTGWETLLSIAGSLIDKLKTAFGNVAEKFKSIGTDIVNAIKTGISNAWQSVLDFVAGLVAKIKINIPTPTVGGGDKKSSNKTSSIESFNSALSSFDYSETINRDTPSTNGNITQVFNFGREVASPIEMARAARLEAQYGLMKGAALG